MCIHSSFSSFKYWNKATFHCKLKNKDIIISLKKMLNCKIVKLFSFNLLKNLINTSAQPCSNCVCMMCFTFLKGLKLDTSEGKNNMASQEDTSRYFSGDMKTFIL